MSAAKTKELASSGVDISMDLSSPNSDVENASSGDARNEPIYPMP